MDDEIKTVTVTPRYQDGTMTDGVFVPFFQALITSLIVAFIALMIAVIAKAEFPTCAGVFFGFFLVTLLGCWLAYRGHWMYIIESVLLKDIDGDGQIGEPQPVPQLPEPKLRIDVEDMDRMGRHEDALLYPDRLPLLARGLAGGQPFTGSVWSGQGKPFTPTEWRNLTGDLLAKGYIKKRNPNQPNSVFEATEKGTALFRKLLSVGGRVELDAADYEQSLDGMVMHATETAPLPSRSYVSPMRRRPRAHAHRRTH